MNHATEISTNTRWEKHGEQEQAKGDSTNEIIIKDNYGFNITETVKGCLEAHKDFNSYDTLIEYTFKVLEKAKEPLYYYEIAEKGTKNYFKMFNHKSIIGINADGGTGKSRVMMELLLQLLAQGQIKKVIYLDADANYLTLDDRKQAEPIESLTSDKRFVIWSDDILFEMCEEMLKKLETQKERNRQAQRQINASKELQENASELSQRQINEMLEQLQKNTKNLEIKIKALEKVLNKHNYLEMLTYILSDFKEPNSLERCVFVFDCLDAFIDDIEKNSTVKDAFLNYFRFLRAKGGAMLYYNHNRKDKDKNGKPIHKGAAALQGRTDYFISFTKPFKDKELYNCEMIKQRVGIAQNYALELDLSQPIGERIKKCDFVAIDENATQKQKDSRLIILESLRDDKKRYSDLKALFISHGLSESDLNRNLKTLISGNAIFKEQVGANVFYTLAQTSTEPPQPKVYEFSDDSQIA